MIRFFKRPNLVFGAVSNLRSLDRKQVVRSARMGALFSPGVFLVCLGLLAIFAPSVILGALAFFFVFLGAFLCLAAWKLIQLKRRFEGLVKSVETRVYLKPEVVAEKALQEALFYEGEDKKNIILH